MSVHIHDDTASLIVKITEFLLQYLDSVQTQTNVTIGVSGGSMPTYICNALKQLKEEDKRRIRLFPVDERLVRADDLDNNMAAFVKELIGHGYDESSFICVDEATIDNAELAAEQFKDRLKALKTETTPDGFPVFDILFLGLGPDGHTCSLFPNHPLLQEKTKTIAAIEDAPKPPPRRVTITLPVINSARNVVFLVTGESKAQVVKEIIEERNPVYPPSLIDRPPTLGVQWFLDRPAASKLLRMRRFGHDLFNLKMVKRKRKKSVKSMQRDAEAARQRYHRLTPDEKKELNSKRTLAQKRNRQRKKELSELEQILRMTNDIVDDPEVTEQLREKRMRARWAEATRTRYQRMSSEERRHHNTKRRVRQTKGEKIEGEDDVSRDQKTKKAEAARLRYHRMSAEERKIYNQRRTEAFRRRRMAEEALLTVPIGRINGEALDRAQKIVVRNAKRAEAARLRYQRMTPEQRKLYNQKRYKPKCKREPQDNVMSDESGERPTKIKQQHEYDALSSLERDVIRCTHQAQQSLLRQRQQ